jgi:putative NADPH-quinone reductase
MIINFHPKEIPSNKGAQLISKLNSDESHQVVHSTDKTKEEWQSIILSDEKLILVAPTYWWAGSYEFDKWVQDVFSYGFAYKYSEAGMPEGLLNGRKFEYHTTQGTPEAYATTMRENMKARLVSGIFGFCNAEVDVFFYDPSL